VVRVGVRDRVRVRVRVGGGEMRVFVNDEKLST